MDLLTDALKHTPITKVAESLNVCVGTVRRWIELNDVPVQYTFDLHRLLGRPIEYANQSSTLKDQFFTPPDIAKFCWDRFQDVVKINLQEYTFIEPSAGDGSFLSVLPNTTIAMDIEPRRSGILCQDQLAWTPEDRTQKYIVFGNPPFGLRGHLALNFITHSEPFADYVCFILPQLFESDGKGSPRKRVQGYNLISSDKVSAFFISPEGARIKVNGVFQIWSKQTENAEQTLYPHDETRVKVYSLSDGGTVATTRNKDKIGTCHIQLPSTCFGKEHMRVYSSFDELPGRKGQGIVFREDSEAMIEKAKRIPWSDVSFLSTNSALNLRTSVILKQFANE